MKFLSATKAAVATHTESSECKATVDINPGICIGFRFYSVIEKVINWIIGFTFYHFERVLNKKKGDMHELKAKAFFFLF